MLRRTSLTVLAAVAACAYAQDGSPVTTSLTPEEMRSATVSETLSLPNPGEIFAAFNRMGKPDWSSMFRKPPSGTYTNRLQLALNLGALIADGCLAVEAQDKQQVKNISREIKNLAKGLGLEHDVVNRSNSISDFAEGRQWEAVGQELDAVQNELSAAMSAHHDRDLITLMALGGWLRAIEVVSGHLAEHYTPDGAKALRQPAVCSYFSTRIVAMPAKMQATPLLAELNRALPEIENLLSFPSERALIVEDVRKINLAAGTIVAAMAVRKQ